MTLKRVLAYVATGMILVGMALSIALRAQRAGTGSSASTAAATTLAAKLDANSAYDPDLAALLTAIKPLSGWTLERKDGSVQPINLEAGRGIQLAFPRVKSQTIKTIPLTLWLMDAEYAAGPAPPMTRPGTPVAGTPRELDRWNGRRVFLFDSYDKGWPDAVPRIEEALKATSGPLVAALVAEKIDGKETLQFELRNRSDQAVQVCPTPWPTTSRAEVYGVDGVTYMPGYAKSDNLPPVEWRKLVVTLKPGERVHWPVDYPAMTAGVHAKFDASYDVFPDDAKDIGIWGGWVVAPTADVRVDETGHLTVTPWKPAVISPAVNAASRQVAAQMERWTGDLSQQLKGLAEGITPEIHLNPNPVGDLTDLNCQVAYNCTFNALGDWALKFEGEQPALALRVSAGRAGDWNDVALAKDAGTSRWDGKAIFREYRVPGTDWIVRMSVQGNHPELIEKANTILDDAYNQLARIAAEPATRPVPTTTPADTGVATAAAAEQVRWGEAVEGVQLRLTPGTLVWDVPEGADLANPMVTRRDYAPVLILEMRNVGDGERRVDNPYGLNLEYDGVVCRPPGGGRGQTIMYKAGESGSVELAFAQFVMPALTVGPHKVRVLQVVQGVTKAVSNVVTVEIQDSRPAATRKAVDGAGGIGNWEFGIGGGVNG